MILMQKRMAWNNSLAHLGHGHGEISERNLFSCRLRALDLALQAGCEECIRALIHAGARTDRLTLPGRFTAEDESSPLLRLLPEAKLSKCQGWYVRKGGSFSESLQVIASLGEYQLERPL